MLCEAREFADRAATLFWRRVGKEKSTPKSRANRIVRAADGARVSLNVLLSGATGESAPMLRDYFSALIFSRTHFSFVRSGKETREHHSIDLSWLWTSVHILGWYHVFKTLVRKTFYTAVEGLVWSICSNKYDTPMLGTLDRWKHLVVLPWLQGIQAPDYPVFEKRDFGRFGVESLSHLVNLVADENYVSARVREFYDIIADFPDSTCAVLELRETLFRTRQHHLVAQALRVMLQRRLLHSGANTAQIIDMYIATIKVLRLLDPRDIFLSAVTFPVRKYLQHRKDTVRCIVANLTDEISGELYQELHQSMTSSQRFEESDAFHANRPRDDWIPQSSKSRYATAHAMGDVLFMLISIYGTKELFVNEYRCMLAEKLLLKASLHSTTQEHKNLELLKLRFGEAALHHCEIMLRDVEDSKDFNRRRRSRNFLEATVISQVFWPDLSSRELSVHPRVDSALDAFSTMYSILKTPRKLVWKREIGMAQLELQLGSGQKRLFTVPLLHANIILHFHGCETITLSSLSIATCVGLMHLQGAIAFWVNHGVLQERSPGFYIVTSKFQHCSPVTMLDEDTKEADLTDRQARCDHTSLLYPYIIGALTNIGKLQPGRLHCLLASFMQSENFKYDISPRELSRILEHLCASGIVEYVHGFYTISGTTTPPELYPIVARGVST
mmetsp:Transcript_17798/g.55550  ORF Transcript_17798/g.55550 Transcript_17798/m.55550 type:complete len:671 (-) Transcript_17798:909-2921(-)